MQVLMDEINAGYERFHEFQVFSHAARACWPSGRRCMLCHAKKYGMTE